MADNLRARQETERHRLNQARLGAKTVQAMLAIWPLLDPENLDATTERWIRAALPIIQANQIASTQLAAEYVRMFRAFELGNLAGFTPVLAEPIDEAQIATSLIVTGPAAVKTHMRISPVISRAMEIGRTMSSGSALRHTLDGGRKTVTETVAADAKAFGWARVVSGRPCGFCAMLASRGPVYREESADFQAHDHCTCGVEPVYHRDAAWPAGSEAYRQLWNETTAGLSQQDAINTFRTAVETPAA